ncbi:GGDEF domain-containing protein [Venenivibrio stagnispumantis]|uniref:diguanylate cyclase n=1 Tax=Venenivibrio stagnispumantis TaxID=407998 RepID=A0AA45WNR3_9AQUI|nr:GGDEF domain-containing protein [Venenivibrio stagnispumantis]MCW4573835.1 GGDEF domain-containing protein [Venenivibrio stagnispumantis]SMP18869.1 diguanylate cyclase (GGDEF) domain-containing protein [Venenivibrio stagnispumantis]
MSIYEIFKDKKIDIIFSRLENYIQKHTKSVITKEFLTGLKHCIEESIKGEECLQYYYNLGEKSFEENILLVESISIFDFLRKNFIAHLPLSVDIREAKRVERLFEDLKNNFIKGYFEKYIQQLEEKLIFLKESTKNKDGYFLVNTYIQHLDYFIRFLRKLRGENNFELIEHFECSLSEWINFEAKSLVEEKRIIDVLLQYHIQFHDMAFLIYNYITQKDYQKAFFSLKDMEAISFWLLNELMYLNTIVVVKEYSTDPLTGVLTRRNLEPILLKHIEIANLTKTPISIIMVDIDHFKKINDTYGHIVGDIVLKEVANTLKSNIRKSDYIFRYGGEEFLILLPHTTKEEAINIAEKLRKEIKNNVIKYEDKEIKVTASFGVEEIKDTTKTIKDLLNQADINLYKAKTSGRDRVVG